MTTALARLPQFPTVQMLLASPMPANPSTDLHVIQFWLSQVRSKNTLRSYWGDLQLFATWAGGVALRDIGLGHLIAWAQHMEATGDAPTSVQRRISALRSLLKFAHAIGWISSNPGAAFKLPKSKQVWHKRCLEPEEVQGIIEACTDPVERLMVRMLYVLGARAEEMLALRWTDIRRRDNRGVATLFGKGDKTRHVPIPEGLWVEIRGYRQHQKIHGFGGDDDWLFPGRGNRHHLSRDSLGRVISEAAKRAGITKRVTPHWFRHSHVTHARRQKVPLEVIQTTVGHSSLNTTRRYLEVDPDESSSFVLDELTLPPLPGDTT
jgi:site-specific recombinase XerD